MSDNAPLAVLMEPDAVAVLTWQPPPTARPPR